ncbi:hypothetical protein FD33_GL000003 [Companilactobacillus paralimentarius DSM 13238 = JCM 10415]|uniref:Uncharacterized protein n=1 Tax=Companilactobacillus paralimentarius DSM 13238 = JCM 10415 TaxID=1122151 RepID=A0A0R1PJZ9_9LACO|nr:hypothetical protein [Companilactobacillus paralimentarius]KRL32573.1 hypothetical protein FD33_GL000003 [Companilactobacillus paralimentarius DSM 13238 = JCM 10415]
MFKRLSSQERAKLTPSELKAYRFSRHQSKLMKDAHKVAKIIVSSVGNYSIALGFALKFVNKYDKNVKALRAAKDAVKLFKLKRVTDAAYDEFMPKSVAGVPAWAIKKDFSRAGAKDILFFTIKSEIISETEKTVQISFDTKNPKEDIIDHHKTWVAKSILAA